MQANSDKLVRDVRVVLHDAEDLIKATSGDLGDRAREARAKLAGALIVTRDTLNKLEDTALASAKRADHLIRSRPYESLGLAFTAGVILGILIARR